MADGHGIKVHSPFTLGEGYSLAICEGAGHSEIQEEISLMLDAAIALLEMVIKEQTEAASVLWGVVYLVRIAQGLNEGLQEHAV